MSSAQKLYNMGVISLEECCARLILIRSMPVQRMTPPRFVKLDGGMGDESALLQKIRSFPLQAQKIGSANLRIRSVRGGFSVSYHNRSAGKQFCYPGRFESQTAAVAGVKYMVYAINNEIERRAKKKAPSAN